MQKLFKQLFVWGLAAVAVFLLVRILVGQQVSQQVKEKVSNQPAMPATELRPVSPAVQPYPRDDYKLYCVEGFVYIFTGVHEGLTPAFSFYPKTGATLPRRC